jgi:hypothetical protein
MKLLSLALAFAALVATKVSNTTKLEEHRMDSLAGKTIQWTFDDGPVAGTTFEHTFASDGSVTWTIVDGPHKGASAREKSYAAMKVNDKTLAISYLGASGHTLTVVLNLDNSRLVGFASDGKQWTAMTGTYRFVQ